HSFTSIFSKANADNTPSNINAIYDVPVDGYTTQDIADINATAAAAAPDGKGDQSDYWNKYCNNDESQGFQNGNVYNIDATQHTDPETGTPEYDTQDPCKLIQTEVCAMGAKYDADNCAPD